ncbi:MAG: hypothetical protein LBE08_12955 [Bifidobacteriaceae bacterium]|jgi:alternate signal-mediated exported protein|nr:hypothetical protein [Bifidobacteriaceae bacterium]
MAISPRNENERRSRRFKALVAGAAGVALLLGGSTFAFWSDTINESMITVKNGVLDLDTAKYNQSAIGAKTYDLRRNKDGAQGVNIPFKGVSDANKGLLVDASFIAVPGDHIEIDVPFTLVATGTNMKYDLQVKPASAIDLSLTGWTATARLYKVTKYDGSGVTATPVGTTDFSLGALSSTSYTTVVADLTEQTGSTPQMYALVIDATLPDTVGDAEGQTQEYQDIALAFGNMSMKVQQVTLS